MNTTKPTHRLTAFALSFLMLFTMTPVTASAQGVGNDGTAGEIIAFEALPQKTQQQTVSLGTALEDLDLPGSLNATVRIEAAVDTEEPEQEGAAPPVLDSGEPAQGNEIPGDMDGDIFAGGEQEIATPSDVQEPQQQSSDQPIYLDMSLPVPAEWASSPAYDGDTAGVYTFTAEIEGFTLSAELPQIIVTVGTPAGVITAFDALAEDIRWQSVEYGTAWEELNLPKTLAATVEGKAAEVPVIWESEPAYDANTKGLYLFTAKLAEGWSAAVALPHIAVVVRAEQPRFLLRSFGGGAQDTDPFLIGTAAQLAEIAALTNEGQLETMFLGQSSGTVYLKLDNDIDLSAYASGAGWTPIGKDSSYPFKGSFDGDSHVITGLYINSSADSYKGLFGYISSGTVKNLGVIGESIQGFSYVGGVAGKVDGNAQVENCYSTGSVKGTNYVGGVAGWVNGTVKNCYSTGSVSGSLNVGGVAGSVSGTNAKVENCAALNSSVTATASTSHIGRVIGYNGGGTSSGGNLAFSGMPVMVGGTPKAITDSATGNDGASKTAADIKAENFFQTLFSSDSTWTYATGKLPGFGAAIEMPDYIIDITGDYFDGEGTEEAPYQISTAAQLAKLAELVNAGDTAYNAANYKLMNSLDLSAYGKDWNDGEGWIPIGQVINESYNTFNGNFDGGGHVITGLYINRPGSDFQGLFGRCQSPTIINLGILDADITGRWHVGGVVGIFSYGGVNHCYVTGSISGMSSLGGIIGSRSGGDDSRDKSYYSVHNCYSSASITITADTGAATYAGGIVGSIVGTIKHCYSTGSVYNGGSGKAVNTATGGVAGSVNGAVNNCVALNLSVYGKGGHMGRVAGYAGVKQNNYAYSDMTILVNSNAKTIIDSADGLDGASKTAAELMVNSGSVFSGQFTEANGWTYTAGGLPILTGFAEGVQDASMPAHLLPEGAIPFAGAGTTGDPYLIKTAQDLATLAALVNAGTSFSGKYLRLENNLDLAGYASADEGKGWTPIGTSTFASFSGNFDGNYKTIAGLYINRASIYQGLFGAVFYGTVKNLGVVGVDISGHGTCGGITGYIRGTVENCFVTGKIQGLLDDIGDIGGIAGDVADNAIAKNCYSSAEIRSNNDRVGGITGQVFPGAKVEYCYSTGSVSGTGQGGVGGIAGYVSGTVQNCAALNPQVSGSGNVGRVMGSGSGSVALENNFAFDGMTVTVNNTPKPSFDKGGDKVDGADLSSATLFGKNGSFWTTAANWDSGAWSGSVWDFADGKLPVLKDAAGNVMPGQSGAPGLYLLNLSTDKLSISLAGPSISGDGRETPYTCPAHDEELGSVGTMVDISVSGMEGWTNPDVNITVKQKDGGTAVGTVDDFNGHAHFFCPANFSGGIIVTAAAKSNPNNEASVTLMVKKRNLTAADFMDVVSSKVYNGSAQELTYTPPNGAGTVTLMYNGNSTVPTDAGTYAVTADVTAGTVYNEATGISLGNFTITPKPVSIIGIQTSGGFYSGSTYVGVAAEGLYGLEARDVGKVGLWTNVGTTADANAGENKLVTVGTCTISGERAFNYTLIQPTGVTVTIKPRPLTINSATVENKEYDGTTTATVTDVTFATLVTGESLELGTDYTATAVFSDANPGTNKTVKVTITSKDTNKAKNYSLPGTTNTTATITPKAITGTVSIDVTQGDSGDAEKIDAGDTLTANISDIVPSGATVSYQWYRGGMAISDATGNSYTIAARATDPAGSLITVKVTGTGNYTGEKTSDAIEIGRIPLGGSVSITGATAVGDTLTLGTDSLTPSDATTSIIWLRDGTAIDGEIGSTYTITKDDLGKTLAVQVSGTGEYSGTQTAQIDVPAIAPEAPANFTASAGNGQLTLNWTAPFDGGSEITKYQLSTDDGASWQDIGVVTTYTITGLTNGTAYTVKLRAVNGIGEGPDASVTATPVRPSSGGGGSSDDNSSPIIVTPPAADTPNAPTQGEIQVPGRADGSGNITATITEQGITAAIDRALAQARQSGTEQNGISLVLNVGTGTGQPINSLSFNLPKAVQDTLIAKGVASVTFVVGNQNNMMLHISMDLAALKEISRQANGNVNLIATRINSGKLTGEGKKAVGARPVFDLKASYGSGKQVQSFGAGSVSVTIPYVLGAGENAGNIQAVYVDANGRVQWLISSVYDRINGVLRFSTNHFSTYGVGYKQDAPSFTDIGTHWAKDDIAFVANRGLFSGTSNTTFSPNTAMTRGMFVTALGRLANADVSSYKKSSFSDVKSDAYYMGYVEWANKNNIINGVGNGRFAPDQSITREQMAVMMSNYAKVIGFTLPKVHVENTFADSAKISAYAKEAVKQMQMAGVISGKNSNLFDPQGTATRAEVSAVLRRFVELAISSDTAQGWTMNDSGKWMYFKDGKPVTGKNNIDGSAYTFDQYGVTADVPKNLRYTTYTVQKGDSFWLIAHKLGCTMSELERLNNKSRFDLIHPGDVLRVPEQ